MSDEFHVPVLLREVVECMPKIKNGVYVDGTLGGGGYEVKMFDVLPSSAVIVGFDLDAEALAHSRERLKKFAKRMVFVHDNFTRLQPRLREEGIDAIDFLLLDLGVSSHQIDERERGFSFQSESRLDMRMNRGQKLDAWTVVNTYPKERLTKIFYEYGEERFSGRIAHTIERAREKAPIDSARDLSAIVEVALGAKHLVKTLARVFQAIRIEVNGELESLQSVLRSGTGMMNPGGRIAVISYHSLEDRIVKTFFKDESRTLIRAANKLAPDTPVVPKLKEITKKPIVASDEEVRRNPRARSAKMRVAEKV